MTLTIIEPGLQTTLQAAPRRGLRHRGVPAAGPADGLSAALVNGAVGNAQHTPLLEITYGNFVARLEEPAVIAIGGAAADITINGRPVSPWTPINLGRGRRQIRIGHAKLGVRLYLAIKGGFAAEDFLGSTSTYLPAAFGGHEGRALKAGDELSFGVHRPAAEPQEVPVSLRPFAARSWVLRATPSAETDWLSPSARARLFGAAFRVSDQSTRMGIGLEGNPVPLPDRQLPKSVPVFPGTVQCPESGNPFILAADAQTTGGYPRLAHIIRAERHRLGQLRPGDQLTFTEVSIAQAAEALTQKKAALAAFLGSEIEL